MFLLEKEQGGLLRALILASLSLVAFFKIREYVYLSFLLVNRKMCPAQGLAYSRYSNVMINKEET